MVCECILHGSRGVAEAPHREQGILALNWLTPIIPLLIEPPLLCSPPETPAAPLYTQLWVIPEPTQLTMNTDHL